MQKTGLTVVLLACLPFSSVFAADEINGAGTAWILTSTALLTFLILIPVSLVVELRVNEEDQTVGLDITSHEESGYNLRPVIRQMLSSRGLTAGSR